MVKNTKKIDIVRLTLKCSSGLKYSCGMVLKRSDGLYESSRFTGIYKSMKKLKISAIIWATRFYGRTDWISS